MSNRRFDDKRIPVYTIIGGMMYDATPDLGKALRYWTRRYTGENYAYFRLYESVVDGRTYRSAIYTKMPLCLFQFADEAVAVQYTPVVGDQIPSVSVWADDDGSHFDYTDSVSHVLKSKDTPHLGSWQRESLYSPRITSLPELTVSTAPAWWQLVRQFVEAEISPWQELDTDRIRVILRMAAAFHDRVFDALNCVHADTVYPDRPERYHDGIYNSPSFEACRVAALFRYSGTNREKCERIAGRLVFDETLSAELREVGPYRVWHNGFEIRDESGQMCGVTNYGTGYSGYPGGMATFVRRLLEYAHSAGSDNLLPRLRQGADWLILVQREDGTYPFTVPTFMELGNPLEAVVTGPESRALGGAAEAARALVSAFRVFGDSRYLAAAERAVSAINPAPPVYAFRGYGDLRDAAAYETDATSAIQLSHANLDLYEVIGERAYLRTAEMLGYYLLTWHYWWRTEKIDPYGLIDPMADSFSPHASPWNTTLASELYSRLCAMTRDQFWGRLAEFSLSRAASLQNPVTGGISEAYNFKMADEITTMGAESGMTTWGILDAGCALLENRREPAVCHSASGSPDARPAEGFELGALVHLIQPPHFSFAPRQYVTELKPAVKWLIKEVLGPKALARMGIRTRRRGRAVPTPPKGGRLIELSFRGAGGCAQGINYNALVEEGRTILRMSALRHDPRIKRVYMPVLDFDSDITSIEPTGRVGKTITAFIIRLANGTALEIEFLDGTTGLGVTDVLSEGRRLLCHVSLKAGWQFGGECLQVMQFTDVGE